MSAQLHARRLAATLSVFALAILLSSLLAACGSSNTGSSSCNVGGTTFDTSTFHLVASGSLNVASDTTYPPQEFQDPNDPTKFIGSDLDLIREIGKRICLNTVIDKANFDDIIPALTTPALGHQRYDLSISAFSITPERQQKVNFVPYFQAGESLLVAPGNPQHIQSLDDLCGKSVAVEKATVELDELNGKNDATKGDGKCAANPINILTFESQDDVVTQLLNGRAVATYQDSPVTGYYVSKNPGKVQQGPITVAPAPEGIVMRKDNANLENAVKKALCSMVSDGKYTSILNQWGQQSGALSANDIGC
ncbi:MAG TPA: ABC transporter substrate-binding protein [Ktedonobacterales bacterium]